MVYQANIFNSEIPEIITAYEERNKIAVPAISAIASIQRRRKVTGDLTAEEDVENTFIEAINKEGEMWEATKYRATTKNKWEKVYMILTEIKNGLLSKAKQEQIAL